MKMISVMSYMLHMAHCKMSDRIWSFVVSQSSNICVVVLCTNCTMLGENQDGDAWFQ